MAALPEPVRTIADAANGTVSRRDLITGLGYPESTVDWWEHIGLLERTHRGELRVVGSSKPLQQQLASMLWRAGAGARLAGGLVLGLHGLDGFTTAELDHVAIPPGRRVRAVTFKVVRTPVPLEDQARFGDLPSVTIERGLIGAAATYARARVRNAYYRARQLKLVTERSVTQRALSLGRTYGAAEMRAIIGTGALTVESPKEWNVLNMFGPADPTPQPQVWVTWRGRWHRLDFCFLAARLALEYDGAVHDFSRERDADRDLALLELGIETIRITKSMMRDPHGTRRRILAVYEQRMSLNLRPLVPGAGPTG